MTAVAHIAESKHDTSYWVSVCLVGVTQINSTLTGDSLYNLMTGNNNFNIRFVQVKIYPNIHPFMCSPLRSHLPLSISGICRISEKNLGSLCSQTGWESKPVLKYLIKKKKKSKLLSPDSEPCPDIPPLLPPAIPWGIFLPPIGLGTGCPSSTRHPGPCKAMGARRNTCS